MEAKRPGKYRHDGRPYGSRGTAPRARGFKNVEDESY